MVAESYARIFFRNSIATGEVGDFDYFVAVPVRPPPVPNIRRIALIYASLPFALRSTPKPDNQLWLRVALSVFVVTERAPGRHERC